MQRDITDPAGLTAPASPMNLASLFYVPDTNLTNHSIRASKNFNDRVMVAAGYGASWLKQDSFSAYETASSHTQGEIRTDNAYLTLNGHVSPDVSVEGHIKYYTHDNNSTFPDALISLNTLVAPRISSIDSLDYGLSANWRPDFLGSNFTAGWRRLDRERDLIWGTTVGVQGQGQGAGQGSIRAPQSLYREDTLSDEVYLKWSARPAKGWTTQLAPSFIWADKTGLVSEPEEAFALKATANYAAPEGWMVSGFYDYKNMQNSNNSFTDGDGVLTYNQDVDNTLHSAGVSLNIMPHEDVNVSANLYWVQNDFSSYLFTTSAARWTNGVIFTPVDQPNYKVDSYVFSLGGDWQYNDKLKLNGNYTFTKSDGDVASGTVQTSLVAATGTIDSIIDNTLHSLSLGADYILSEKATLRVNYIFDYYDDNAYDLLTSGVHTLALGVAFTL